MLDFSLSHMLLKSVFFSLQIFLVFSRDLFISNLIPLSSENRPYNLNPFKYEVGFFFFFFNGLEDGLPGCPRRTGEGVS